MHRFSLRALALSTLSSALLIGLAGCGRDSSDVLGQAYVAPVSLNLRREVAQKNSSVAVLKHGQRVSVIDIRRRFVKVRTANGEEGWVDSLQLLSPEQMEQIRRDDERALAMPSEGAATVFEALNIHLEPNRQSPAFARIPDGGAVVVLAHRVEAKTSAPPKSPNLVNERPPAQSRRQRKERFTRNSNRFLPPPPPPPKPPANWQELSAERIDGAASTADIKARNEQAAAEKKAAELKKPVILEDWSLVRTKDNQCGWVLSRNLVMSIPDEVAQYAEGKRITSYFDLGAVKDDEKGTKHHWLWTTASAIETFDFDAWRVFLWNRRRHRYETSHRQHDVEGYFPVHVDAPDSNAGGARFQLITKDDDGKFRRRTYLFDGSRVHLTATEDYRPGVSTGPQTAGALDTEKLQAKMPRQGWFRRRWTGLKQRLFGKN
ncbi:MAG: SH3 domain-containing protein [Acidobacteriaceae bacterium]|nr:SH3 domain-containing protein [Acidobacteriaceae bacterium]